MPCVRAHRAGLLGEEREVGRDQSLGTRVAEGKERGEGGGKEKDTHARTRTQTDRHIET